MRTCGRYSRRLLKLKKVTFLNIKEVISQTKDKLIVIDNADIMLDDVTRKYISLDDKNQYLIIGVNNIILYFIIYKNN